MAGIEPCVSNEWKAIQQCWYEKSQKRKTIEVQLRNLQAELEHYKALEETLEEWLKTHE